MKKTILIFGGGDNQLTLIRAAKELGVKSIVIDPSEDAPGKREADIFEVVAPQDYELTKKIAQKYRVEGIVTSQMENPLRLMAKLADDMNFIFPSVDTIERCRNKFLMKETFINTNVPCANGVLVSTNKKIPVKELNSLSLPLIIKPLDAHSSRGVYKVNNINDIVKYEKNTREFSSDGSFIIEEFIEGPEYSIEAITYKGKTSIIQYTEKIITPFPHTVEMGHIQPAELSSEEKSEIDKTVKSAINALGIDNTATHTELKITPDSVKIIEVGARLGGDYISSYLTLASTGVNMDKAAIQIALGINPDIKHTNPAVSYIKYLELKAGHRVKIIENWKHLLEKDYIVHANINLKEGDRIAPVTDSAKRGGFVLVKGKNRKEALKFAEESVNMLESFIKLE